TSSAGQHTFTLTATSSDGQSTTAVVHYNVSGIAVSPGGPGSQHHFRVFNIKGHLNGVVTMSVEVPAAGTIDILETDWKNNGASVARVPRLLQPAPGRFVWARKHVVARAAAILQISVRPNRHARAVLGRGRYPVRLRLWVTYRKAPAGPS